MSLNSVASVDHVEIITVAQHSYCFKDQANAWRGHTFSVFVMVVYGIREVFKSF